MECHYNTIKSWANVVMDHTASPAYLWLLSLLYVCFLLNNTSCKALNGAKPWQVLTGSTNDIVGHHMTFKILMDDTKKIIHCSNVHSALSKEDQNFKVDLLNDDFFIAKAYSQVLS